MGHSKNEKGRSGFKRLPPVKPAGWEQKAEEFEALARRGAVHFCTVPDALRLRFINASVYTFP
ncbi:MAG: hypothetical protein LBH85_08815 [Treponema sp.]|jgi:hypothetical protein|nr:hypothetical protein [Treponema sp.]